MSENLKIGLGALVAFAVVIWFLDRQNKNAAVAYDSNITTAATKTTQTLEGVVNSLTSPQLFRPV